MFTIGEGCRVTFQKWPGADGSDGILPEDMDARFGGGSPLQ
jgi:hypothetical protein